MRSYKEFVKLSLGREPLGTSGKARRPKKPRRQRKPRTLKKPT